MAKKDLDRLTISRAELSGRIGNVEQKITEAKYEKTISQFTNIRAVQVVLEERHQLGTVYGAVAQLADVDPKYRLAMDVAAGSHVSSLVVDSDNTAQKAINYLREHKQGFACFLPLNKIKPRFVSQDIEEIIGRAGVYGLATELAEYDNKFNNIFSYVFGNTLIVEDIDVAREIGIGRVRMVTLEGDILETSGGMKGGFRKARNQALSFSQGSSPYLAQNKAEELEEKIEEMQAEIDKINNEYEKVQKDLFTWESKLQVAHNSSQLLEKQKQDLEKELASLDQELSLCNMSKEEYTAAMQEVGLEKKVVEKNIVIAEEKIDTIQQKIENFNKQEEEKKQRVFALQEAMQAEQNHLNTVVEDRNEKRVLKAKLETKQENLAGEVYTEMSISIESIIEKGEELAKPEEIDDLQTRIQKFKYKLSLIGGIDEEVVEEFSQTRQRHEELFGQLEDLQKAMKDLKDLIVELDAIMKKKRDKAFKQIKKEFKRYFKLLFEGGEADIIELYGSQPEVGEEDTQEEDIPEEEIIKKKEDKTLQGIDITACPPGKKIKNIQALSGGERTLTSIALVCAILHTNPSPFVVLDEVEAALDEANTLRFTKILSELAEQSQFIIITHNRATMHAADVLYGVTMGNEGVSKLLSVKIENAKEISS